MKNNRLNPAVFLAAMMILSTCLAAADYAPGELIVKVEPGVVDFKGFNETPFTSVSFAKQQFASAFEAYQPRSIERVFKGVFATPPFRFTTKNGNVVQFKDLSQVYLLKVDSKLDIEKAAAEIRELPGVVYAHPNYLLKIEAIFPPSDFDFDSPGVGQWGLNNPDYGWDINTLKAWSVETGNQDILVAILDTGIEPDHCDESTDEFYAPNRIAGYWNGPYGHDDIHVLGHGSHVAGIVAATTGNQYGQGGTHGVAGVAGGWNSQSGVRLLIARLNQYSNSGLTSSIIAPAIEWATEQGADVLNGSFGGSVGTYAGAIADAVADALRADMTIFFAAGNQGVPELDFPASLSGYGYCSAVGNITNQGLRYSNSSYGTHLSFVAPGTSVFSTSNSFNNYYISLVGTSMASPHAAGIGALLHSSNSNLLDVDCKRIMEKTSRDIYDPPCSQGWDSLTGYGCVDAWESLRHLYWPYAIEHQIIPHSQLTQTMVGYQKVVFMDDQTGQIASGEYWCDKYELSGSVSFTSSFQETPWFWSRILSVQTGYTGNNPCDGVYQIDVNNLTASSASFKTYAYLVKYDAVGNVINKWVPCNPANIQVAITALGPSATLSSHYASVTSNDYGAYSDVVVDNVNPEVPNDVYISYYDSQNGDLRCIKDNFSGFNNNELVDATGDVGPFSSIALDPQGNLHIAYYDVTNNMGKHAWKDASGWHTELVADQIPDFGGLYTSIAVDRGGTVQACAFTTLAVNRPPSWTWNGNDLTWFYRTGTPPYNWSAEPVDIAGNVGKYCALAVDDDGTPHISYYDETNTSLKYATRTGGVNPSWVTTTVDNSADVGKYTSIAVDKLGNPHISYFDVTNGRLKYAHKDATGWHTETIGLGEVIWGMSTSICIDDDGMPVISYGIEDYGVYACKKYEKGWTSVPIDNAASEYSGTSVGIDNLGRTIVTYQRDSKLYVARRIRWFQESGYGLMASNNAGIEEAGIQIEPAITSIIANETPGMVSISYSLPAASNIHMVVYDVSGREVKTLYSGQQSQGSHELTWAGLDNQGHKISKGVYFVRMVTDGTLISKKVTILR